MSTYYIFLPILIMGVILGVVFRSVLLMPVNKFRSQAPLIKKYWVIVGPYSLLVASAYFIVWRYYYSDIHFNILGQLSALIFAIFVGYIAFSELSENRFDKRLKEGMDEFRKLHYNTAVKILEEAHKIKPKNKYALSNLLEAYLITGEYEAFDNNIDRYKSLLNEDSDFLDYHYLTSLRFLITEHLKEGKEKIRAGIDFVKSKPDSRARFTWGIKELRGSDSYKNLGNGTKKIIDNFFKYLGDDLDDNLEQAFIDGDFELTQANTPKTNKQ